MIRAQAWAVSCSLSPKLDYAPADGRFPSFYCSHPILMSQSQAPCPLDDSPTLLDRFYGMWRWLKHWIPMDSSIPAITVSPSNGLCDFG